MQHKITFKSKGLNCSALFYLPNNAASAHNRYRQTRLWSLMGRLRDCRQAGSNGVVGARIKNSGRRLD